MAFPIPHACGLACGLPALHWATRQRQMIRRDQVTSSLPHCLFILVIIPPLDGITDRPMELTDQGICRCCMDRELR